MTPCPASASRAPLVPPHRTDRPSLRRPSARRASRTCHALLACTLALGIAAPKVTLAAALALGVGLDSVVPCIGAGLVRVTVSASGEVVPDGEVLGALAGDASERCAPVDVPVRSDAERAWSAVRYAALAPPRARPAPPRVETWARVARVTPARAPPST